MINLKVIQVTEYSLISEMTSPDTSQPTRPTVTDQVAIHFLFKCAVIAHIYGYSQDVWSK